MWLPWDDNYEVSIDGEVRNRKTALILKKVLTTHSYHCVSLGYHNQRSIHRLVATLFLPAPTNPLCVVDHRDRNKLNNHASNLRWVLPKHNSMNKDIPLVAHRDSETGEHHISFDKRESRQTYNVRLRVNGKSIFKTGIKTLPEAIEIRDRLIAEMGDQVGLLV